MKIPGEKHIDTITTHWMKYARTWMIMILLIPISFFMISLPAFLVEDIEYGAYLPFMSGLTLLLLTLHWSFHRMINEFMVHVLITNKRVVFLRSSPLFRSITREFQLERMQAVEGRKLGLLQNLFGYGMLNMNMISMKREGSKYKKSETTMNFVPNPSEYSQVIMAAITHAIDDTQTATTTRVVEA